MSRYGIPGSAPNPLAEWELPIGCDWLSACPKADGVEFDDAVGNPERHPRAVIRRIGSWRQARDLALPGRERPSIQGCVDEDGLPVRRRADVHAHDVLAVIRETSRTHGCRIVIERTAVDRLQAVRAAEESGQIQLTDSRRDGQRNGNTVVP